MNSLEEILQKVLLIWKQDYPKPDGDNGLLMDEYFERLEQAKVEAKAQIESLLAESEEWHLNRLIDITNGFKTVTEVKEATYDRIKALKSERSKE